MMITAVPLLYVSYTVTRGLGTFRLEPPLSLNLAAGWSLFKASERNSIEQRYAEYQKKAAVAQGGPISIPGMSPSATPPPAANELVRVEQAIPLGTPPTGRVVAKNEKLANPTPPPKGRRWGKKQKLESPPPAMTPAPMIAQKPSAPSATPFTVASAATPPNIPVATPAPAANASNAQAPAVAQAPSVPTATPVPVLPAQPVPADASNVALASNAGGGGSETFSAGTMPLGRLIGTSDLRDVAEHRLAGERIYLKGQFVVNFSDANKAVLRPRTKLTEKVLHFGAGGPNARIIVEFPAGSTPPGQGSVVTRDEARPYEITEIRKEQDGQLNVFAREIMQ